MTLCLGMITFDSDDPEPLGRWWAEQFGAKVKDTGGGFFVPQGNEFCVATRAAAAKADDQPA